MRAISTSSTLTLPFLLLLISLSSLSSSSTSASSCAFALAIPDTQPAAGRALEHNHGHVGSHIQLANEGVVVGAVAGAGGVRLGKGLGHGNVHSHGHGEAIKGWKASHAGQVGSGKDKGKRKERMGEGKRALLPGIGDDETTAAESESTSPVAAAVSVSSTSTPSSLTTSTAPTVTPVVASRIITTTAVSPSAIMQSSVTPVITTSTPVTTASAAVITSGAVSSGSGVVAVTTTGASVVLGAVSGVSSAVSGNSAGGANATTSAGMTTGTAKAIGASGTTSGVSTMTTATTDAQGSVVYVTQVNTPTESVASSAMVSAIVDNGSTIYTTIYNTDVSAQSTGGAGTTKDDSTTFGTGAIVGVSVAGAVVLAGLIAFLVWKLRQKRFGGFDDDDVGIKWPELNKHGESSAMNLPLPAKPTGGHGFATSEMERSEKNFLDDEDVSPSGSDHQLGDDYSNYDVAVSRAPSVNKTGTSDFIDDTPPPAMPDISTYGFPAMAASNTGHVSPSPRNSVTSPAGSSALGRKKSAGAMSVLSGTGEEVPGYESPVYGAESTGLGRSRSGKLL